MTDKNLKNQLADPPAGAVEEKRPPAQAKPAARPAGGQAGLPAPASVPVMAPRAPHSRPGVNWRLIIWGVLGTLAAILLVVYGQSLFFAGSETDGAADQPSFVIPLSPTPTASPSATPLDAQAPSFAILEPTATPTPVPGGRILVLSPAAQDAGWVVSRDESIVTSFDSQNHFGDSFLYAGVLADKVYHAALQFDLRRIPRGTEIYAASLRLTGLRADQLAQSGESPQQPVDDAQPVQHLAVDPFGQRGEWRLQLLGSEIDDRWRDHDYEQIHTAPTWATIGPVLTAMELGEGQVNLFEFTPQQLDLLERRILEGSDRFGRQVSFRLDGPADGDDNLFAWDSGYGPASKGKKARPELVLSLGPAPQATPPPYYLVITSTPTPETIMTAVANSLRMTAEATRVGTATPMPPNWVTPVVVTATPTPENQATARAMAEMATAIALTTGEPPNLATATSTPTYVIITSTPTPEDIMTAAAQAMQITAQAIQFGTATPFPANWVTPVVVNSTPTPENAATVEYQRAIVLTTGTPTPTPGNVQTATPTPIFITVAPLASATATATPTATPQHIPASLLGKIVFLSDREGATEQERVQADKRQATPQVTPQPYVFDPATGQLARLTDRWPYEVAAAREAWSADLVYEAYTKELLWTNRKTLVIHYYDYLYNVEQIVTRMGVGIVYDPAWSPVSDDIAFVATESGNDEIWLIKRDGTDARQLTRNDWEWDKHPTWSPDGQQLVFWSNRTGNNQLWIMNKDGGEQRLLMAWNPYNDWDPIWIKTLVPLPPLQREPDWRFVKPPEEVGGGN